MNAPNQSFNAWSQQQPAPAGFAPQGAPPAAPPPAAWGPPTAPAQAPAAPPVQAPPVGYGPPPVAMQPLPSGGNVFGAGAFAGAAPVSEQKDCQDGDYVFQIIKTEQFKTRESMPMLRILTTVAHVYAGTQPLGSEVTDSIYFGVMGSDSFKYGMSDMLALAQHALSCRSDHELKAKLQAAAPQAVDGPGQPPGTGAWASFADAMQDANQQLSPHFGPNPLKGLYYRAQVRHEASTKKTQRNGSPKIYTNFDRALAQ